MVRVAVFMKVETTVISGEEDTLIHVPVTLLKIHVAHVAADVRIDLSVGLIVWVMVVIGTRRIQEGVVEGLVQHEGIVVLLRMMHVVFAGEVILMLHHHQQQQQQRFLLKNDLAFDSFQNLKLF